MRNKLSSLQIFWLILIAVFLIVISKGVLLLFPVLLFLLYLLGRIYVYLSPEERERRKQKMEEESRQRDKDLKIKQLHEMEKERLKLEKYQELRKSIEQIPKYEQWKKAIFEKHGDRCEVCGTKNNLEIHHRTSFHSIVSYYGIDNIYKAFECDALWDVDNGSVICKSCHEKTQSHQYRSIKMENNF